MLYRTAPRDRGGAREAVLRTGCQTEGDRSERLAFSAAARRIFFGDLIGHSGIALFCAVAMIASMHAVGDRPIVWLSWSVIWACFAVIGIRWGYRRARRPSQPEGIERFLPPATRAGSAAYSGLRAVTR